jgi:hypothetical protein
MSTAATYVVNPQGTGDFPTIQEAIDACVDGDVVELTDGTFTGDGNRDIDYLGKAITVRSQSRNAETCIIDCQGSSTERHRGFRFHLGEGSDSELKEVTVTGGHAPIGISSYVGGAISIRGASPTLEGCVFAQNQSTDKAGALLISSGAPVLVDCDFIGNTAHAGWGVGGGAMVWDSAEPTFENCTFVGNTSHYVGGGVYVGGASTPSFIGCTFEDNISYGNGGGVCTGGAQADPSYTTIEDCTFAGNHAVNCGGGLGVYGSTATVIQTEFQANTALNRGGGMQVALAAASATVSACVFVDDEAPSGAALDVGHTTAEEASATLTGCTIVGAISDSGAVSCGPEPTSVSLGHTIIAFSTDGPAASGHPNFTLTCCDIYGNTGGDYSGPIAGMLGVNDNISEDPCFCDAAIGNYAIWDYSPCAPQHSGGCDLIGALPVSCTIGIAGHEQSPLTRMLAQNFPNPFNPSTTIEFELPRAADVDLRIYDAGGRLVRRLLADELGAGLQSVNWDGRDDQGQRLGSGVYFCRLRTGDRVLSKKLILLR